MLAFKSIQPISIFVCHERGNESVNAITSEFLLRTGKADNFELIDLLHPSRPRTTASSYSFDDFIVLAEAAAKSEHMLLIKSPFRISMNSVRLMQHAHIANAAQLSVPTVKVTKRLQLPVVDLRSWIRAEPTSDLETERLAIECLPFKYGRCEAIHLHKTDVAHVRRHIHFQVGKAHKWYARGTGNCKIQRVVDSVLFS